MQMPNTNEPQQFHFYASTVASWVTDADVTKVINKIKRNKLPYNLFYVPLPPNAGYDIEYYQPVVEGLIFLGTYGVKE